LSICVISSKGILSSDYPYYYRPAPAPYAETKCQPSSAQELQAAFQCFEDKGITELSFNTIGPCAAEVGALGVKDLDCLRCFAVQATRAANTAFRQTINTAFTEVIEEPDVVSIVFSNCVFNPAGAPNGFNSVGNSQDESSAPLDQNVYKRNTGLLILLKDAPKYLNGSDAIFRSDDVVHEIVEDSAAATYVPSFPVQRGAVSLLVNDLKVLATHLPFELDVPLPFPLQEQIMQQLLQQTYDVLLGDFNSAGKKRVCGGNRPQCLVEGYQSAGFNYITNQDYRRLDQFGDRLPIVEEPRGQFGYGTYLPRGVTYCHNDLLPRCVGIPDAEKQSDLDHIFYNPTSKAWIGRFAFKTKYFAWKSDRPSDHVGLKSLKLRYF
jgi:hypothetical protein